MSTEAGNQTAAESGAIRPPDWLLADTTRNPLADAIAAIGTDDFDGTLMAIGREWFKAVQLVAFKLDGMANCSTIAAESTLGEANKVRALANRYQTSLYNEDPCRNLLIRRTRETRVHCRAVRAEQLPASAYRETLFDEPQLSGKVALLSCRNGPAVYLNFYRGAQQLPFEQRDLDLLSQASGILVSLLDRHLSLVGRSQDETNLSNVLRRIENRQGARLSDREHLLCTHLANGVSVKTAAIRLGVSENTAISYRRRAFLKLGIGTQKELFALLLTERGIARYSN